MSMLTRYLQSAWPLSSLNSEPNLKPTESRREPIVHSGHTAGVTSVAFSADGKSVVSGSDDATIRMWDAYSPSPIGEPLTGHTFWVRSVSYSPLGNMIASGACDCTIGLWDANTGKQVGGPLWGHDHPVNSVAFSPAANLIASGSDDTTIRLWDVQSRTAASTPFKGHTEWVSSVVFSPDGTRLASGSADYSVRVWDVEHGTTVVGPLKGSESVQGVAFSPNGSQIVSASWDWILQLWDARNGNKIGTPFEGHTNGVHSVAFSPNGIYLASGSRDRTIRLWDVRTGRQVDEPFRRHTGPVVSVAFSPSGRIASASKDETVMIWSLFGGDSDVEQGPDVMIGGDTEISHFDCKEAIDKQMTIQDMFDRLSGHGCVDLASQMDVNQDAAVVMNGGGFGDIWMGYLRDGTKVAIKAWRGSVIEQCDYKLLKRATREIYYWSKMKHENVHQLMGVIMFKGQSLGMVSEWMDNGNMHEYLRKNPSADRFELSVQVASGLTYIHDYNMVHGDLKGLNVLVSSSGVAKLTDFGLSAMSESSLEFSATTSPQAGSIRWAAPELLLEESGKSKEADVYALGMTILEIFTGAVPYSHIQRDYLIIRMIDQGVLPTRPMNQIQDDVRGNRIWGLLVSCWNREPGARPSAAQVVESRYKWFCRPTHCNLGLRLQVSDLSYWRSACIYISRWIFDRLPVMYLH